MPLYDYDCASCGERFEILRGVHAAPPAACVLCGGGPVKKAFTTPAIHFKGSGWAKKERQTGSGHSSSKSRDGGSAPKDGAAISSSGGSEPKDGGSADTDDKHSRSGGSGGSGGDGGSSPSRDSAATADTGKPSSSGKPSDGSSRTSTKTDRP